MSNLSKTLHINFYQNRSSIVEVMIKNFWCVFMPHSVVVVVVDVRQQTLQSVSATGDILTFSPMIDG